MLARYPASVAKDVAIVVDPDNIVSRDLSSLRPHEGIRVRIRARRTIIGHIGNHHRIGWQLMRCMVEEIDDAVHGVCDIECRAEKAESYWQSHQSMLADSPFNGKHIPFQMSSRRYNGSGVSSRALLKVCYGATMNDLSRWCVLRVGHVCPCGDRLDGAR